MAGNESGQTRIGTYVVLNKLGEGGMGAVYKAHDPALERDVALKVLPPHLASDPEFVVRFKREATAAAKLSHGNLVHVYAVGEEAGTHYIAMEFVAGGTLMSYIRQQHVLSVEEALAITIYAAEALRYAWNKAKIIHRDIKPDNILLSDDGEVKIADLGLAKSLGTVGVTVTGTGTVMGSPQYISPEQARGDKEMDFRVDIYSLGCTLFHMLTGRPPYDGNELMPLLYKHVNEPPPDILPLRPECPPRLAALLKRMMAKDRNHRPSSYDGLIAELTALHNEAQQGEAAAAAVAAVAPTVSVEAPTIVAKTPGVVAQAPSVPTAGTPTIAAQSAKLHKSALPYGIAAGVVAVAAIAGLLLWSPWKPRDVDGLDRRSRSEGGTKPEQKTATLQTKAESLEPEAIRLWDSPNKIPNQSGVRWENSVVVFSGGTGNGLKWMSPPSRDAIIRADVRMNPDVLARQIGLRLTDESLGGDRTAINFYRLTLHTNVLILASVKSSQSSVLQEWPLPRAYSTNEWVRLELRAVGDELTASVNGRVLGSVHDNSLRAPGGVLINGNSNASFRNIAYIPLDKSGTATASAGADQDAFIKQVTALPAEEQVKRVVAELKRLNPGFDGNVERRIENSMVTRLVLPAVSVTDITPVRALAKLRIFDCCTSVDNKSRLENIAPLAGLPLTFVKLNATAVGDLSPLRGMPLTTVNCSATRVGDLSPLAGISLTELDIGYTRVSDLSPLKGMPLEILGCNGTDISDLTPLQGMPLKFLLLHGTQVKDLSALRGMPLKELSFEPVLMRSQYNRDVVRSLTTLEKINKKPAAEFWKQVDAGKIPGVTPASGNASDAVINLLPLVDPSKHTVRGEWSKQSNEQLDCSDGPGEKLIYAPFGSVPSYDLTLVFWSSSAGNIQLHFDHGGRQVRLDVQLMARKRVKLYPLVFASGTTSLDAKLPMPLPLHQAYNITVQVRPERVTAFVEGQQVIEWKSSMGTLGDTETGPGGTNFGVSLSGGVLRVREWKVAIKSSEAAETNKLTSTDAFIKEVAALPAEEQVKRVAARLKELNPGFDGNIQHEVSSNAVVKFSFSNTAVTNISPVRALSQLKSLSCGPTAPAGGGQPQKSPLTDLSPLAGMPLTELWCAEADVRDLSPLKGMPLESLWLSGMPVTDLKPVTDLPLLTNLMISGTHVQDLSPLRGTRLRMLIMCGLMLSDLTPLKDLPLENLDVSRSLVNDLAPLRGMPLKEFGCNPELLTNATNRAILQAIPTLEKINGKPAAESLKQVDAGKTTATGQWTTLPNGWRVGKPVNLGSPVNSQSTDDDPRVSADGLTLLFTSARPGGEGDLDLWACTRRSTAETWGTPLNLGPTVNSSMSEGGACLSLNNLTLFFHSRRPGGQGDSDLWMCTRLMVGNPWGRPVNFGPTVNRANFDVSPTLSADGLILVFASLGRSGGQGSEDLWMCTRRTTSDPWTSPVNLGSTVNSSDSDAGPSLSGDGLTLIFHSRRPRGQGGCDLWMSTRRNRTEPFGDPVNLGIGINSESNELTPSISSDGRTLYFASDRPGGLGGEDIYQAPLLPPGVPVPAGPTDDETWQNAINLLPLIDPQEDAVTGTWVRVTNGLMISDFSFGSRLQIPYQPPEEYDFRVTFSRLEGDDAVALILTKSGRSFGWGVGNEKNSMCCFSMVGGKTGGDDNPTTVKRAGWLVNNRPYTTTVSVRRDGLKGFLNGELIAEWKTDYGDMSLAPMWKLRNQASLGLGSKNRAIFHSIELREVTGKGKLTRSAPSSSVDDAFVKEVAALPAEEQVKRVAAELQRLNPGFDGNVTREIWGGWGGQLIVGRLAFNTQSVTNISPVGALRSLQFLGLDPAPNTTGVLTDLSPLKGLPLIELSCAGCPIRDLLPLKGMPLKRLVLNGTPVEDLTPLSEMPLTVLRLSMTPVRDLSPLKGMQLTTLNISGTRVTSLEPVRGMPLQELFAGGSKINDLTPLKDAPLRLVDVSFTGVTDLSPLRAIKTLETINSQPAAEFWKNVK